MTCNRWLAQQRGLSEETIDRIDFLHTLIENLIKQNVGKPFSESVYNEIEGYEYLLQECWGFPKDCDYHSWKNAYKFKNQWVGKKYQCLITGEIFEIPYDVEERGFYSFGEGCFIDVGRLDGYYRIIGNLEELK